MKGGFDYLSLLFLRIIMEKKENNLTLRSLKVFCVSLEFDSN